MLNRLLLLVTGLLAAYQITVGIEGLSGWPIVAYTVAFGVLLVAALLLLIFGHEILESSLVVIVTALIPLSLSAGLVLQHLPGFGTVYMTYTALAMLAIGVTRYATPGPIAVAVLAAGHGVAGLIIFGLPLILSLQGRAPAGIALVGLGGALIGVGGILLALHRSGRGIIPGQRLLQLIPTLLLVMTLAFVMGFSLA